MSETMLELKDVTQRFGGLCAASHVSLHVDEKEIVGLIGPNGAGKTTTFNVITGVYDPTDGKVFFEGHDITGMKIHCVTAMGMARTFQNIRLFNSMTVLENVLIGMHIREKTNAFFDALHLPAYKKAETAAIKRALQLLAMTGLASFADNRADSLPYGSQRRLEIVRAMATGARLLLLDEPAAGMNEQETADLMAFIRTLRKKGYTVFLIEHDMRLVMNLCDRIYVQNHGELIAEGNPDEIQKNRDVIDAYLGEEV